MSVRVCVCLRVSTSIWEHIQCVDKRLWISTPSQGKLSNQCLLMTGSSYDLGLVTEKKKNSIMIYPEATVVSFNESKATIVEERKQAGEFHWNRICYHLMSENL